MASKPTGTERPQEPREIPTAMELLQQRRKDLFIGRQDERDAFRRNFDCELSQRCLIFAFHGQAGIGKSFLVARYQEIASAKGALTAVTDEAEATAVRDQSIVRAMARLASQFAGAGAPLDTFDQSHRKYRDSIHQVEADPDAPAGTFGKLARATARIATGAAKATLVGQAAEGALRELGAGEDQLVDWAEARGRYLAEKFKGKHDLVALVKEPVQTLTPLFVQDLNALANDRPVVLCFDTWERTSPHLDAWLRFLYEPQGLSAGVWVVIAGRQPPGDAWEPFLPLMACFELQEFTEDETRDYLRKQGVTGEARVQQILAFSGGVPVLVSTLASAKGGSAAQAANSLVERYLTWVEDPRHRQAALRCAAARRLDKDVVAAVMGPDDADALFDWLTAMPFVQTRPGYWEYHPKVRKLMLRFARSRSVKDANAVHARLRAYYRDLLAARGDEPRYRDETWRRCTLEALYHGLMQESADAEREGLDTFLVALRRYYPLAGEVATAGQQAAEELETATDLTNWAGILAAGWAAIEGQSWQDLLSFREALDRRDDLSDAARASLYLFGGLAYLVSADYEQAMTDFNRAIELAPELALVYRIRGLAYAGLNDYELAIADYDQVIELNPEDAAVYRIRGLAYAGLNDHERAIADFDRAIELDPEDAAAYHNRGFVYAYLKDYERAIADFDRAIELDPEYAAAYHKRGAAYAYLKDYQQTIADFDRAIELDPEDAAAYHNRGAAYAYLKDYQQAIADFDRAIELDPEDALAYHNRGAAYVSLKDYERAIADCDRAIDLDPEDAAAYNNRGAAYADLKDYERAIADYDRAIDLDPEDTAAYNNRGTAYAALNDYERAIADYDRAIDLDPDDPMAYYNTACAYALQQNVTQACDWLQKAIALDQTRRDDACTDHDFDPIRDHPSFQALLATTPAP